VSGGASKDEILLTLDEWADLALDEYAKPMKQGAIEYLAIELVGSVKCLVTRKRRPYIPHFDLGRLRERHHGMAELEAKRFKAASASE
jgi:hypothetical protein